MVDTAPGVCAAFVVPAEGYDRLMGRFLTTLGPAFADAAGVRGGQRVLDVGCGPGGLTGELAVRVGAGNVAAIDPSPPFVEACRNRHPGVDARVGVAEQLPYRSAEFDVTLASLVVGFLADANAGVAEMVRVTRPGGTVAVCFWDAARMPAIQLYWSAAATVDASINGEVARLGSREGDLTGLLQRTGLREIHGSTLHACATYADFDDWWGPLAAGVGPAGQHLASVDAATRAAIRSACMHALDAPRGPFTLPARAWCARGTA